jgi:hypothetical protein
MRATLDPSCCILNNSHNPPAACPMVLLSRREDTRAPVEKVPKEAFSSLSSSRFLLGISVSNRR